MKKIVITSFALIILTACNLNLERANQIQKISIGEQTFTCEVASSSEERQQGLMQRESLAPNHGMLFKFPKANFYTFWMKDTPLTLDIIWIDENQTVSNFVTAPPCLENKCPTYKSEEKSLYVVEIAGNTFQGKIGDKFELID